MKSVQNTKSTFVSNGSMILVIFTSGVLFLMFVNQVEACHRRVEYHTYYKKPPMKGWGWGSQGGHHGHEKGWGWKGQGDGGGHMGGHKGHMGHGKGHHMHGYGKGHHMGYGKGHMGGGHGKGHMMGYGHMKGHMKGYGNDYGGGHGHGNDYGGGHSGHGHGGGYMSNPYQKGMKYKHSTYEMSTYNDKGGRHRPQHGGGHAAHQQGYGYSGPYPNTEYSHASYEPEYESLDSPPTSSHDAADTANYLRNIKGSSDTESDPTNFYSTPIINDAVPQSSDSNSKTSSSKSSDGTVSGSSSSGSKDDGKLGVGNFDLNLEFNSDLPGPFKRNDGNLNNRTRKRKKISSTFKASRDQLSSLNTKYEGLKL